MAKFPIIGAGYQGRSSNVNASRLINFYPELNGEDSKSVVSLVGTSGTSLFVDTLLDSARGLHFFNNVIYFVAGDKLFYVDSAKTLFPVLDSVTNNQVSFATNSGPVSMADNGIAPTGGNQLCIADGINLTLLNVFTSVSTSFSSPSKTVCFIGGYFLADMVGGGQWGISGLYDGMSVVPWDTLDRSTADAYPDNLMSVVNNHNEAWFIGEYSTEIWINTGIGNPPFSRVSVIDYGTNAPHSVAKGNNTVFFLASLRNGDSGEVFGIGMANGYGIEIVSTPAINYQISKYAITTDAVGFCFTENGHVFYQLTFPTANATWVYDATTKLLHERSLYNGSPYTIGRHIANAYCFAWGKHYVGAYNSGKIFEMSESFLTDAELPIASVRICSPLEDSDSGENVFISKFQIDAETGSIGEDRISRVDIIIDRDLVSNLYVTVNGYPTIYTPIYGDLAHRANDTETLWYLLYLGSGGATSFITLRYIDENDHSKGVSIRYDVSDVISIVDDTNVQITKNYIPVIPSAVLSFSIDGGHTWSNDRSVSIGSQGGYISRMIWRRLGSSRNRTFRIAISDPIKKVLIGAYFEMEVAIK